MDDLLRRILGIGTTIKNQVTANIPRIQYNPNQGGSVTFQGASNNVAKKTLDIFKSAPVQNFIQSNPYTVTANKSLDLLKSNPVTRTVANAGTDMFKSGLQYVAPKEGYQQQNATKDLLTFGKDYAKTGVSGVGTMAAIANPFNLAASGAVGAAGKVVENAIGGKKLFNEIDKGIESGVENAWILPFTNYITNSALKVVAPSLTDEALNASWAAVTKAGTQQALKKNISMIAQQLLRGVAETPAETVAYTGWDILKNNAEFKKSLKTNFESALLGNLIYHGAAGAVKSTAASPNFRKIVGDAVQKTLGEHVDLIKKNIKSEDGFLKLDLGASDLKKMNPIEAKAAKAFGITDETKGAAFITTDGKLIDGTGRVETDKKFWSTMTDRTVDHRDIASAAIDGKTGGDALVDFMHQANNIRIALYDDVVNVDFAKAPTKEQIAALKKISKGKQIFADITGVDGNTVTSGEFKTFKELETFINQNLKPAAEVVDTVATQASAAAGDIMTNLSQKAKQFKTPEEFYQSMGQVSRKAGDVKVGQLVKFTAPEGSVKGAYGRDAWYGKSRLKEFNDASVIGKVVKINPTSLTIEVVAPGSISQGQQYKIPKDAGATEDLSQFIGKSKEELSSLFNLLTSGADTKAVNDMLSGKKTLGQVQVEQEAKSGMNLLTEMNNAASQKDYQKALSILEQAKADPKYKDYINTFQDLTDRIKPVTSESGFIDPNASLSIFGGGGIQKPGVPDTMQSKMPPPGGTGGAGVGSPPKPPILPGDATNSNQDGGSFISMVNDRLHKIYTSSIDRFHPLTELAKQAGGDNLKKMQWALAGHYGAGSTANYHVEYEMGKILRGVDNVDDLKTAAVAMRDLELAGRNIQGSNVAGTDIFSITKDNIKDAQSANAVNRLEELRLRVGDEKMKQYGEALQAIYKYQDDLVKKYLVDTGIMSNKAYTAMRANNKFYVPYRRVMDQVDDFLGFTPQNKGAGSIASQNVIKTIKGSDKAIEDPLESIVENTYKIVALGKRQEVAKTIISLQSSLPAGMIKEIKGNVGNTPHVDYFINGKVRKYAAPTEVVEAARGMREETLNKVVKVLAIPTGWFRSTATGANPEFAIPNTFRDLQTAFVNVGLNPLAFTRGLAHLMKQDETYQAFLKSGAQTSRVSLDRPYLKETVNSLTDRGIKVTSIKDAYNLLQTMGEYSEQPTRIAVWEKAYNTAIKNGLPEADALKEAALQAQDTTTNFARRGADTKSFNAIYAFLNARAQGTDKLIRSFKDDPVGVGTRLGMITIAPAIALYMHNNRFASYNDERIISDRDKRDNFIFMLSDTPIESARGAQYIKIPKGDPGKLANPIEAYLDYALGQGGDVGKSVIETLLAFSPVDNVVDATIPTAAQPLAEVAVNKDFYTNTDLVPMNKKNYPAGFQDNSFTSPIFRALGEKFNISPAKMQQIAQGYGTGWVRIADMVVSKFLPEQYQSEKNQGAEPINTTPIIRRFAGGAKRSEQEQLDLEKSRKESLDRQVSTIRNAIKKGEIPYDQGSQQIERLQKEYTDKQGGPQSLNTVQNASEELAQFKSLYELDRFDGEKTGVAGARLQSDRFAEAKKIIDGTGSYEGASISEEAKKELFTAWGVKSQDVEYYSVATDNMPVKRAYIQETVQFDSPDKMQQLARLRYEVNGERVLSDTMIDDLYDDGKITADEKKFLKNIKYSTGRGFYNKSSLGGGGSKSLKSIGKIDFTAPNIDRKVSREVKGMAIPQMKSFRPSLSLFNLKTPALARPAANTEGNSPIPLSIFTKGAKGTVTYKLDRPAAQGNTGRITKKLAKSSYKPKSKS